jgi:hypothetical protein
MIKVNSQIFTEADIENGLFASFLKTLMDSCYESEGFYNDIHITPIDCGDFCIEWIQTEWKNQDDYPKFKAIEEEL